MKRFLTLLFILLFLFILAYFVKNPNIAYAPETLQEQFYELRKSFNATDDPVIVAVGDIACASMDALHLGCRQQDTFDIVRKVDPDAIFALGDLQYPSGTLSDFLTYYDASWGKLKEITYPVPGNHEYATANARGYFDYFNGVGEFDGQAGARGKGYYSFKIGKWHVIALNSNCWAVGGCGVGSSQTKWLENDLQSNNSACTVAFAHHPRFSSGHHGSLQFIDNVWNLFEKYHVELFLAGHDHNYERFAEMSGVTQFVVGTGGYSLYSFDARTNQTVGVARNNADFGVLKLVLHDKSFDWEFVSTANGTFKDAGSRDCN